jgi:hypothetical protein
MIMGVTDVVICDSGAVEMFGILPVKRLSDVCSVEVFVDCWYVFLWLLLLRQMILRLLRLLLKLGLE